MIEQPSLFDVPEPAPRPAPRAASRPGKAAYTRRPGSAPRVLCDDCCRLVHELGIGVAPHPLTARWRRQAAGVVEYLCPNHCEQRKASDPT